MNDLKTTNTLLMFIVVPVVFYLLKILSFIFVPLLFSMFLALLFLPMMRWLRKRKIPNFLSVVIVILIIIGILKLGGTLVKLASHEILSTKDVFYLKAQDKLLSLVISLEQYFGIKRIGDENIFIHYFKKTNFMDNIGNTFHYLSGSLTTTLMTIFFTILLLAESLDFERILNKTILKRKRASLLTFGQIEKDIITFVKVKVIVSALTGLAFSLACVLFDVSFPIFWGLFAFAINFVQLIGSVVAVVLLSFFGFVELESYSVLLFFIITLGGIQILFGSVVEPVMMGKSFSINILTILIMLSLWGFIWGIAGMVLAIPITVLIKIILAQFPKTEIIAEVISGVKKKK